MLPFAEGSEEGQELAFGGGIVVLGGREFFGEAADELVASRLVVLVEGAANGMVTRIKIEMELELGIWKVHGDLVAHGLFESIEGGQFGVTPSPGVGGLEKLGEGRDDVRVVLDEALVESTKAEEGADVLGALGGGPIGDGLDLFGLFLNPLRGDNETAEVDARHGEDALRPLGEEFFCAEFWSGPGGDEISHDIPIRD